LEQRFISAIARDTYGRDARLPEVVTVISTCIGKLCDSEGGYDFRTRRSQARERGPEARGDAGGGA
jgi:hypothetical protein